MVYSIMSIEKAPLWISTAHYPMLKRKVKVPLPTNACVSFKKLYVPRPPPLPPPTVWGAYMGVTVGIYVAKWAASNSPTITVGLSLFTFSTSLFYVSSFPESFGV
jgi:hypothetical protein